MANAETSRFRVPLSPAPSPRLQLAMSEGSTPGGASTGPAVQGYNVPGRNPNSEMAWEFFLGNAAHRLIAYIYKVNHPRSEAFYNKETLFGILAKADLGEPALLLPNERNLRPDITDITVWVVFEIKPWGEKGLQEGRQEVRTYLAALPWGMSRRPSSRARLSGGWARTRGGSGHLPRAAVRSSPFQHGLLPPHHRRSCPRRACDLIGRVPWRLDSLPLFRCRPSFMASTPRFIGRREQRDSGAVSSTGRRAPFPRSERCWRCLPARS